MESGEYKQMNSRMKDQIRGCLFGGAVGDALGYPIEFNRENEIFHRFGSKGIRQYRPDYDTGTAIISDDTQMALFTANGILVHQTNMARDGAASGIQAAEPSADENVYFGTSREADLQECMARACGDWLTTQRMTYKAEQAQIMRGGSDGISWLLKVPELFDLRAPGNTCLAALEERLRKNDWKGSFLAKPINNSKGCGGIMRIAPVALVPDPGLSVEWIDLQAAESAAVTHGHPLGYMSSAVLAHVIRRIVFPPEGKKMDLKEIILEAKKTVSKLFKGDPYVYKLQDIIDLAVLLAEPGEISIEDHSPQGIFDEDLKNIHMLGEGWVAEETLGISLYCALKHQDDFSAGLLASVNHKGDSDSTGAVAGNILGALHGYSRIEEKWKKNLELSDVILEIADDLAHSAQIRREDLEEESDWARKYM